MAYIHNNLFLNLSICPLTKETNKRMGDYKSITELHVSYYNSVVFHMFLASNLLHNTKLQFIGNLYNPI